MAKILYGVAGEGMGHALRSKTIIDHLKKKHKLKILTSNRAYRYMKNNFNDVGHIACFRLIYINNSVSNMLTFLWNCIKFPFMFIYNIKIFYIFKKFKPDIVISDFEPFTNWIANLYKIKTISIDNQHILTDCEVKIPKKYRLPAFISKLIINSNILKAECCIITSFYFPKILKKNRHLFNPIIRKKLLKIKPKEHNYFLVYQTSKSNTNLLKTLKKFNNQFVIYGFNRDFIDKNLHFRKFSEKKFLQDFKNCKAVIVNGGFTVISEALQLKKPILTEPIRWQFEQIITSLYVKKLGYGMFTNKINEKDIKNFIKNIPTYKRNLKKYKKSDNKKLFNFLDKVLVRSSY